MPDPAPTRPLRWFHAMLVMLLGVIGVGLLFHRITWSDWSRPHWLGGDPLEVFARVKIAAEQPLEALFQFTHISRLGAPTGADWIAYPVPDRLVFVLTGLFSRAVGLIAAINLVSALILGLNAASFFLCARWLRCRWEWALALSLIFAFCNYNVRWGITLSLSQTFVLPPLVLLCAWSSRRGQSPHRTRSWKIIAVVLGLWLGLSNPYLGYFAGVVSCGALVLALVRRNPLARKLPLLIFIGCLLSSFGVSNAGYIEQRLRGTTNATLPRNPGDFQVYALRPVDWLMPPADSRVPALAKIGRAYTDARSGTGEFFYNYLGLVGVIGLVGLLGFAGRALVHRQWQWLDPVLGLIWITAFGIAGGINSWLGTIGLELFRASTRIGIFAHLWIMFFLCIWVSRQSIRWPRFLSVFIAAGIALVACWEQTPPLGNPAVGIRNLARWQHYQDTTSNLEHSLGAGATVFQLPAVPFPEAGPTHGMPDYEHVLPFLTSDTLHFSYGHLRHSPALAWARHISKLPPADMVAALELAGFSALWIDQRAYAGRREALIHSLYSLGLVELPSDPALPVKIFRLNPAEHPQSPDYSDPRIKERWQTGPDIKGQPLLLALQGWFRLETTADRQWRWAGREAALGIWWDGPDQQAKLRFRLDGQAKSTVQLRPETGEPRTLQPAPDIQEIEITLSHGLNTFDWQLQGPTFKPGGTDPRQLGFMVENLSVSVP